MQTALEQLKKLLYSHQPENIALALEISKGMGIDLYKHFQDWGLEIFDIRNLEEFISPDLKQINANRKNIRDIEPLRGLTFLERIYLNSNQISSLAPLEATFALTHFELTNNNIQADELAYLKNNLGLKCLGIGGNRCWNLSFLNHFPNLQDLHIQNNGIGSLKALTAKPKLKYLNLSNNKLSTLEGVEKMQALETLGLDFNQLTNLEPLRGLPNLERLLIRENLVRDLSPLHDCPKLKYVSCYRNPVPKPQFGMLLEALPEVRIVHRSAY
jgi:internalin A